MRAIGVAPFVLGGLPYLVAEMGGAQNEAQDELERVVRLATPSIAEFREQIGPMLTEAQRKVEENTKMEVVDSWEVQAKAKVEDGKRVIEINGGLVEIFDWIATAIAAIDTNNPQCAHQYITYLFSEIDDNSGFVRVDIDEDKVYPPFTYAKDNPQICSGVSEALITKDSNAQQMKLIGLGSSIYWTLAHELAHHLHKDETLEFDDPPTSAQLRRSRFDEQHADKFAFEALSRHGFSPLGAMPAYLFIGIRGAAAEDEDESTHPSGPERFRVLYNALDILTSDPDFRASMKASGQLGKWNEAMKKMRKFSYQ